MAAIGTNGGRRAGEARSVAAGTALTPAPTAPPRRENDASGPGDRAAGVASTSLARRRATAVRIAFALDDAGAAGVRRADHTPAFCSRGDDAPPGRIAGWSGARTAVSFLTAFPADGSAHLTAGRTSHEA